MIATVDINVQAANPSMPLFPMRAFEGSPSSIRIRNVPKRIGDWVIDKVYFAVTYPDNSTQTIECKLVGGVYVGTIAGCDTIGNVKNGYSIFADGKDENGNAVTDYCLGKGDVQILDARGITQPLQNTTFVQILSAHPAAPNDGDMWYENDAWYVWQNGQAMPLGDDSAIIGNLSERVDELSAELSSKQDELTDAQLSAIDSVVSGNYLTVKEAEEGYTEWVITPPYFDEGIPFDLTYQEQYGWVLGIRFEGGGEAIAFSYGPPDVTTLTYTNIENVGTVTATRCRITPAKTSQLSNDGSDGVHPFATIEDLSAYELKADLQNDVSAIVAPLESELDDKLDFNISNAEAWYPGDYSKGDLRTYNGILYKYVYDVSGQYDADNPEENNHWMPCSFALVSDVNAKQDKLAYAQISAINSIVDERATAVKYSNGDISVFNLVGTATKYDVSSQYDIVEVKFGSSVTTVGAFNGAGVLISSINLPNSITAISDNAFSNSRRLTGIVIPESVTYIGEGAFGACTNISSITIPNNVTTIGAQAFGNNPQLTSVTFVGKTLEQVYDIESAYGTKQYPWGIADTNIISTYNAASQEWVKEYIAQYLQEHQS